MLSYSTYASIRIHLRLYNLFLRLSDVSRLIPLKPPLGRPAAPALPSWGNPHPVAPAGSRPSWPTLLGSSCGAPRSARSPASHEAPVAFKASGPSLVSFRADLDCLGEPRGEPRGELRGVARGERPRDWRPSWSLYFARSAILSSYRIDD